jgi:hypothetical protein
MAMVRELRQSEVEEGDAEKHGFIYRFHPSLNQGIVQLKRVGAKVAWNDRRHYSDLIDGIFVGVFLLVIACCLSREPLMGSRLEVSDFQHLQNGRCDAAGNFESNDIVLEHLLSQKREPLP